jgi:hypothetical protein
MKNIKDKENNINILWPYLRWPQKGAKDAKLKPEIGNIRQLHAQGTLLKTFDKVSWIAAISLLTSNFKQYI